MLEIWFQEIAILNVRCLGERNNTQRNILLIFSAVVFWANWYKVLLLCSCNNVLECFFVTDIYSANSLRANNGYEKHKLDVTAQPAHKSSAIQDCISCSSSFHD